MLVNVCKFCRNTHRSNTQFRLATHVRISAILGVSGRLFGHCKENTFLSKESKGK